MNADSARIRPFFRSLFGLSPMNADMSVPTWPSPDRNTRFCLLPTELPALPTPPGGSTYVRTNFSCSLPVDVVHVGAMQE